MMMPMVCFFMVEIQLSGLSLQISQSGFVRALGVCAVRERGRVAPGSGERAIEFLPPVGDIPGRAVAIDHAKGGIPDVGQLVKHTRRNVNRLAGGHRPSFFAKAHLTRAFDDKVNFFLFLIMPWNLPAPGIKGDIAHAEVFALDGCHSSDEVLGASARGIAAPFDLCEVGDGHDLGVRQLKNR
jgi:hypothetical protein